MPGRFGGRMDQGFGLGRVDRPVGPATRGSYRTRGRAPEGPGGTVYPSVLEAYNRDSDYERWVRGKLYWQGGSVGWADKTVSYLVRTFRDFGIPSTGQLNTLTLFPSRTSPEGSWTVVNRRRGAVVLPQPLAAGDITLDQSMADPSSHRLVLDVSSTLSADQLGNWRTLRGSQFEDSAYLEGGSPRLLENPDQVVALTLVEVDVDGGRLLFDLSRPFVRARAEPSSLRGYWKKVRYNQRAPLFWSGDDSRVLCSSHRLYCSCPDFSGMRTANTLGGASGEQEKFPRPAAGRNITGSWESEVAGYRSKWRDLSPRADQRRECKHAHAVRWGLGYPFYEPSDYTVGDDERQFLGGERRALDSAAVSRYQARRQLTLDRVIVALADSMGVLVDTRDIVPDDEEVPTTSERPPILWTTSSEPPTGRARVDDWWLRRGTNKVGVFDPAAERFVDRIVVDGESRPVIEEWPAGQPYLGS